MPINYTRWHEWPSNFSNGTREVDGIGSVLQYTDSVVGGWLGSFIMIATFLIITISLRGAGGSKSAAVGGFVTSILSMLLYRFEMDGLSWVVGIIVLTILFILAARGDSQPSAL